MHVTFLTTGGTIFQKLDPATGSMAISVGLADVLPPAWLEAQRAGGGGAGGGSGLSGWAHVDLKVRSGAELSFETIFAARDAVRAGLKVRGDGGGGGSVGFVVVTGTDTLEEFAFVLDLLLGEELVAAAAPLVVTGAMKPYDIEGYDGRANLQQAVQVALSPSAASFGVLVTLNDCVHSARWVSKADSQLMGAFRSGPVGPVAQVREGRVRFYHGPPPHVPLSPHGKGGGTEGGWDLCLRDPRFAALDAAAVAPWTRVGIWTTAVSGFVPAPLLRPQPLSQSGAAAREATEADGGCSLSGLVLAAPGTGSLSAALTEQLAAAAPHLPIVLVSRCGAGNNSDEAYYRGSRAKYEGRGLLLAGFEHCTPLQARNLLVLRLAAGMYPQFRRQQ